MEGAHVYHAIAPLGGGTWGMGSVSLSLSLCVCVCVCLAASSTLLAHMQVNRCSFVFLSHLARGWLLVWYFCALFLLHIVQLVHTSFTVANDGR